jgi:hypothetical protein
MAAFGVWIAWTSRGAYAWYAKTPSVGTRPADTWFAMFLGPRLMTTIYFLLGIFCMVSGMLFALGIL